MLLPFQGVITFRHVNPGCRCACPGLCAPLGLQPALAKSEISVRIFPCLGTEILYCRVEYEIDSQLNRSLPYAKVVQTECRTSSLLERYAEVQPILCKGTTKS